MKFRNKLIALSIVIATGHAAALSLGDSRSIVVLGRSPDLLFNIEPDPGVPVGAACITAEVLLGTTPVSASKIQIVPAPDRPLAVRLRASVIVNEPIVTVHLLAGCSGKIRRTYTFLTDLPDAVVATATPLVVVQPARRVPPPLATASAPAAPRPSGRSKPLTAPSEPPSPHIAAESSAILAALQKARNAAPEELSASPLAIAPASAPPSKATEPALPPPHTEASAPVKASTAPVPALVPVPEVVVPVAVPASVASVLPPADAHVPIEPLKTVAPALRIEPPVPVSVPAANESWFDDLMGIEWWSFSDELVYGLLALLATLGAGAGWAWHRTRGGAPWHRTKDPETYFGAQGELSDSVPADELNLGPTPDFEEDIALFLAPEAPVSVSGALAASLLPPLPVPAPLASMLPVNDTSADEESFDTHFKMSVPPADAVARVINPEDLFDLQEQADFFASVGEHDQAIDVMKKHITENEKSSPLVYLDLMRLYHSLSRRDDFNELRDQFKRYFNANVPDFVVFHRPGLNLGGYPEALARIEAQWSTPAVLKELESCLFQHDKQTIPPFDLGAYDDLLLLYAVAKTTPPSARGVPPPRTRTTPFTPESLEAPETLTAPALFSIPETPAPIPSMGQHGLDQSLDFDPMAIPLWDATPATPMEFTPKVTLAKAESLPELPELPKLPVTMAADPPQPSLGLLDSGLDLDMGLDTGLDFEGMAEFSWDTPPVPHTAPAPAPEPKPNSLLTLDSSWDTEPRSAPEPVAPVLLNKKLPIPLDFDLTQDG